MDNALRLGELAGLTVTNEADPLTYDVSAQDRLTLYVRNTISPYLHSSFVFNAGLLH